MKIRPEVEEGELELLSRLKRKALMMVRVRPGDQLVLRSEFREADLWVPNYTSSLILLYVFL